MCSESEKHYLNDVKDLPCDCKKILEESKADGEKIFLF